MYLELPKHKKDFLLANGFEQTYTGKPRRSMGVLVLMEGWEKCKNTLHYKLCIHFSEDERSHCNLYCDSENEAEVFSERNLVSEMRKRGFNKV